MGSSPIVVNKSAVTTRRAHAPRRPHTLDLTKGCILPVADPRGRGNVCLPHSARSGSPQRMLARGVEVQWPPRRYPLDDGVVAADQGAKALARMRRSRPRRRAGETRSEELLARTFGVQRQEHGVQCADGRDLHWIGGTRSWRMESGYGRHWVAILPGYGRRSWLPAGE